MNFPTNVKYTSEHEWIRMEGDVAYVGITDYAQEQLGDIVFVDIQTEGETLAAGDAFGTIEVVKSISDLFMPVAGEVLEQNEALADQPELVNKDPYGEGWLIKVKPAADADFDTDVHEAIAMVPGMGDDKKGKVLDCIMKGYKLNDKVIRHAKVAVGQ